MSLLTLETFVRESFTLEYTYCMATQYSEAAASGLPDTGVLSIVTALAA